MQQQKIESVVLGNIPYCPGCLDMLSGERVRCSCGKEWHTTRRKNSLSDTFVECDDWIGMRAR